MKLVVALCLLNVGLADDAVVHPGKAKIFVRESATQPASVAPARTKAKKLETQANALQVPIIFE